MIGQLNFKDSPPLERPLMVVGWRNDAGDLGRQTCDYLRRTMELKALAEIEPAGFFPMTSVEVSSDLVSFPSSRFYYSDRVPLITFFSDIPSFEVSDFLKLVLDAAARYNVGQVVPVNGFPMMLSHNMPSPILANMNSPLLREWLSGDDVNTDINYESPPGQKPPISNYLIWEARRRGIEAVSLWVPVPYYLAPQTDGGSSRRLLALLRQKMALPIDLTRAEDAEKRQRDRLGALRDRSAEVDKALTMLESNLSLTEYEAGQLAAAVRQELLQP